MSKLTQPEAERVLNAIYDLLLADNSTQLGFDDRVSALLFKMAYVSFVDDDILTVSSVCSICVCVFFFFHFLVMVGRFRPPVTLR